jgi:hypothetical protein
MTTDDHRPPGPKDKVNVLPSTRVAVAFPFSKITTAEPTETLEALADLVRRMAEAAADVSDEPGDRLIADDADQLLRQIRSERRR